MNWKHDADAIIQTLLNPRREPEAETRWMPTREAAKFTGLPESYLVQTRQNGSGPPFTEVGNQILYERRDLILFMRGGRRLITSRAVRRKAKKQGELIGVKQSAGADLGR
jgi:hypothetical protein